MKAVRISAPGGPEAMQLVEVETPTPGRGEILIRQAAVGLNFIDTYYRSGLYKMSFPAGLGREGAGTVEAVGPGVTRFKLGDRVAYASGPNGAYAEAHAVAADTAVRLPDEIDFPTAAASMLRGMTAEYLMRRCGPQPKPGETVLIHAAAGGVGILLVQWAKAIGLTVIGTVGSPEKAKIAKGFGADHVILYDREDVAARVRELTGGKGVPVVYDGVGKDTFEGSLKSLARRGLLISFGNSSGPAPAVEPIRLLQAGSVFLTRPTLVDYTATVDELDESAEAWFAMVRSGKVKVEIGQTRPLSEVRQAHEDLEARRTIGATVLIP